MKRELVIQRLLAFVLLVLFAFSATPKKYWHDLLADHTDYGMGYVGEGEGMAQGGLNCHCDDLVVSVPFTETVTEAVPLPHLVHADPASPFFHLVFSQPSRTKESRGPPSVFA